jgi:hypothetical protein
MMRSHLNGCIGLARACGDQILYSFLKLDSGPQVTGSLVQYRPK